MISAAAPLLVALVALVALQAPAAHAATPASDPMERLWGHRLIFDEDGGPLVTVRIDEGEKELRLVTRGEVSMKFTDGERLRTLRRPAGTTLIFRLRSAIPAGLRYAVQVADHRYDDKAGVRESLATWAARSHPVQLQTVGGLYGIAGRVLDTRRYAVLLGPPGDRAPAQALIAKLRSEGERAQLFTELASRPSGVIELVGAKGEPIGAAKDVVELIPADAAGVLVRAVEHDHGYAAHGREDRSYRGELAVTIDAEGLLALVNVLPMEELLRGIVPSELFASAPIEALMAQSVTARGEVLAKIGARHLGDPYLLCAEQHCQVYKGRSGEHPATDAAIVKTRGEALFGHGGALVDSVYSSTCGGHTEDNEVAWGGQPNPNLRGVPDWLGHPEPLRRFEASIEDGEVAAFLAADVPSMCKLASFSRAEKVRWERRFSAAEVDQKTSALGVGKVVSLTPLARGVSGRASALRVTGERGSATVEGELVIRRLFGNLNSSLFVVERDEQGGFVFRGAGWGHGVGMCQTGAIGRAEKGHDHHQILGHYYGGAQVVKLY